MIIDFPPPRAPAPIPRERQNIIQGECKVSDNPEVLFSTVLGSCVSACLFDPVARVGGMNHFLLAQGGDERGDPRLLQRYGVHAMEVLINGMLARGAARHRLRARLFGGASMHDMLRDIGADNIKFARSFLRAEGISLVAEDLGGKVARRVDFQPAVGQARCRKVFGHREPVAKPAPLPPTGGQVELF